MPIVGSIIYVMAVRTKQGGSIMKYRVIIEQDEGGVFVAEVPSLPGCISQGATRVEALKNIQEAIEAYLESLKAHDEPVPPSINEEVIEVSG
jgi:predicted RNase H-like HicB family nuclease